MHPFSPSALDRLATVIAHPVRGDARLPRGSQSSRGSSRNRLSGTAPNHETSRTLASNTLAPTFREVSQIAEVHRLPAVLPLTMTPGRSGTDSKTGAARGWQKGQKGQKPLGVSQNRGFRSMLNLARNRQKRPETSRALLAKGAWEDLPPHGRCGHDSIASKGLPVMSKADGETSGAVRIRPAAKRESGALIRAGHRQRHQRPRKWPSCKHLRPKAQEFVQTYRRSSRSGRNDATCWGA